MCAMTHTPTFREIDPNIVEPSPWNANTVSQDNEEKLRSSIERHGMFKPILVRQIGDRLQCVGGWNRCEQAIELGMQTVPAFDLGPFDDAMAKEISLADNARYGIDDLTRLNELLEELDTAVLEETMPWTASDIDAMTASIAVNVDDLDDIGELPDEEEDEEDDKPAKAPKTHQLMKFRVALGDAGRINQMISETMVAEGFTAEDDASNAGAALAFLLLSQSKGDDDA